MPYYLYHPETFEYLKTMQRNTKKLPNVTKVNPNVPFWYDGEEVYVFFPEKEEWKKFKELREFKYDEKGKQVRTNFGGYLLPLEGDTNNSQRRFNKNITDPLPHGAVVGRLPCVVDMVAEIRNVVQNNYIIKINNILNIPESKIMVFGRTDPVPSLEFTLNLELVSRVACGYNSFLADKLFREQFNTHEYVETDLVAKSILDELDTTRFKFMEDNKWLDNALNIPYIEIYKKYIDFTEKEKSKQEN